MTINLPRAKRMIWAVLFLLPLQAVLAIQALKKHTEFCAVIVDVIKHKPTTASSIHNGALEVQYYALVLLATFAVDIILLLIAVSALKDKTIYTDETAKVSA